MTKRWGWAVGLGALLLGASSASATEEQFLALRTPRVAFTVRVTDRGLTSPDIQVSHKGTDLRGRMFDNVVFLDVGADRVTGTVGNQITRLNVREKDGGTEAQGNFLGRITRLNLGPQTFTGNVGNCGYDLKATAEGTYEGTRSCGGLPEGPVILSLPPALTQQGPAMTMLALAMVLATG